MNGLNSLLPQTESVLLEIAGNALFDKFTFIGGSAISIYLSHRKSEDLDFFSWEKTLDPNSILSAFDPSFLTILNRSAQQLDLFYKGVKITFFASGWDILQQRNPLIKKVYIAPLEILTAMKINTLFLRAKYRDYYDLYTICKEKYSIEQLYVFSQSIVSGLNIKLFQTALTFTDDIADDNIAHLSPRLTISKKEIETFFIKEIKRWNKKLRISALS